MTPTRANALTAEPISNVEADSTELPWKRGNHALSAEFFPQVVLFYLHVVEQFEIQHSQFVNGTKDNRTIGSFRTRTKLVGRQ